MGVCGIAAYNKVNKFGTNSGTIFQSKVATCNIISLKLNVLHELLILSLLSLQVI